MTGNRSKFKVSFLAAPTSKPADPVIPYLDVIN